MYKCLNIWQLLEGKSSLRLGLYLPVGLSSNWPAWFVNFHGLRWAQTKCQPFRFVVCFPCRKVKGPLRNKRSFKGEFGGKYEDKLWWVHFRLQKGLCFPNSSCFKISQSIFGPFLSFMMPGFELYQDTIGACGLQGCKGVTHRSWLKATLHTWHCFMGYILGTIHP